MLEQFYNRVELEKKSYLHHIEKIRLDFVFTIGKMDQLTQNFHVTAGEGLGKANHERFIASISKIVPAISTRKNCGCDAAIYETYSLRLYLVDHEKRFYCHKCQN
jgi:hypothetical protein